MENNSNQEKKKITKAHIFILVSLIAVFIGYGYYEVVWKAKINGSTLIDNPTNQNLSLTIDGESYEVPANSFLKVDLAMGIHKLDCKAYNLKAADLNISPVEYGVINPTKSKYVIYTIIYTEKDLTSKFKPYQVEGREIYSLFDEPKVTTDLFIADLTMGKGNIDVKEPSLERYNKINQDYSHLTKIFRLNEFFEFYDKNNK